MLRRMMTQQFLSIILRLHSGADDLELAVHWLA